MRARPSDALPDDLEVSPNPASEAASWASAFPAQALQQALSDPSRRVGQYVVLDELGRGGMGVVYHAHDPQLGRDVAIKMILDPSRAGRDEVARFQRSSGGGSALSPRDRLGP